MLFDALEPKGNETYPRFSAGIGMPGVNTSANYY